MNAPYDDYRAAVAELGGLRTMRSAEEERAEVDLRKAMDLVEESLSRAGTEASEAMGFIEQQLDSARTSLDRIGKSNLVPPRIRPSDVETDATSKDIAQSRQALVAAVNSVQREVEAEIRRADEEGRRLRREAEQRERRAREAAERAELEAARRRRLIRQGGLAALAVLVVLVLWIVI